MDRLTQEEMQRLYELYFSNCENNKVRPTIRDFVIWCQEEGYDL